MYKCLLNLVIVPTSAAYSCRLFSSDPSYFSKLTSTTSYSWALLYPVKKDIHLIYASHGFFILYTHPRACWAPGKSPSQSNLSLIHKLLSPGSNLVNLVCILPGLMTSLLSELCIIPCNSRVTRTAHKHLYCCSKLVCHMMQALVKHIFKIY